MPAAIGTASLEVAVLTDTEFRKFRELIYKETGIVLNDGKRQLVISRLTRRLRSLNLASFSDYYDFLSNQDPHRQEITQMTNCITTNKTDFFREPHHFDFLREQIATGAQTRRAEGKPQRLRIWSAGCSTGEEPYTIAITLAESVSDLAKWDVKILATDIDTEVLRAAQQGRYEAIRQSGLSMERRRKYFDATGRDGEIVAKPQIRETIAFRRLNLIGDTWPMRKRFDFIFCRNVIIYFDRPTQERLLRRFATFLEPGGFLFVGHAESLFWAKDFLAPVGDTVYRSRQESAR